MGKRSEQEGVTLTIVVPVFNEIRRLDAGLRAILDYLETRSDRCEIVLVDDGSTDGTADRAEEILGDRLGHRVIRTSPNRGKGHAVKVGMLAARGDVRLFTDIDLSVPIETADEFSRLGALGADVVIGTRKVRESQVMVHQPFHREFLGGWFRWTSRVLCAPPVTDFTCGFKAFSAHATRAIFSQSRIDRWSFDAEILFLAYTMGLRIVQVPVTWCDSADTKVRLGTDLLRSLTELACIVKHRAMGRYILAKKYQGETIKDEG